MKKINENDMVYTPYITLKNGRRLYASQFGKKVFCFPRTNSKKTNKD